ncbi:MAG: hypothetical protein HY720_27200, partial [Planctomycetes bacterium]|nr:hypothetical protein [Planctomycetota bacterium]
MRRFVGTRPIGVWIALASILFLLVFGIGGQSLSLVSWDLACRLGLQENRFDDPDVLERAAAHFEWGSCAADVLVVLPLLILGFVGVACRRHWGAVAALMAAACWIYAFFDYTVDRYSLAVRGGLVPWEKYSGIVLAYGLLGALPSALVVVGIAANMDRFAARRPHSRIVRSPGDSLPGSLLEDLLICTGQVLWT